MGPAGKLKGTEPLAGDLRDVPSLIWTMEVKSHPCLRGGRTERGSCKRLLPGRTEAFSLPVIVVGHPAWAQDNRPLGLGFISIFQRRPQRPPAARDPPRSRNPEPQPRRGPARAVPWGFVPALSLAAEGSGRDGDHPHVQTGA